MKPRSLRSRMMILFCAVVGVLLIVTLSGFYFLFDTALREQLDSKLQQTAAPIIADLMADPFEKDVDQLDIPGQYFEVLDSAGNVTQRSKNLAAPLVRPGTSAFQTVAVPGIGNIRVGDIPFIAAGSQYHLLVGAPTDDVEAALATMRRSAFLLFPISLLLTAAISNLYVARSLKPVVTQLQQFASDASHELRTPLSVLRGETELLLTRHRSAEDYEEALKVIDAELKKLSHIVDGLFTLSMADAGELQVEREPLYLEEVLEDTCRLAAPLADSKQIRIERNLKTDVLFHGDAAFLRQLFLIFIDNAIKYSPAGTRLKVSLEAVQEVVIRFEDQGIGISPTDLPLIFKRFFRVAQNGSGETQSGGLGLSIAQAIVQAHHGTIACESRPGLGSTFTVRLPL